MTISLAKWAEAFMPSGNLRRDGGYPDYEKQWNVAAEAKSLVLVPVFIDTEWWVTGFEDCGKARESLSELEALKTLALLFGAAIKRKRMEEELQAEKVSVEEKVQVRTKELKEAQEQLTAVLESKRMETAKLTASIHSLGLGL